LRPQCSIASRISEVSHSWSDRDSEICASGEKRFHCDVHHRPIFRAQLSLNVWATKGEHRESSSLCALGLGGPDRRRRCRNGISQYTRNQRLAFTWRRLCPLSLTLSRFRAVPSVAVRYSRPKKAALSVVRLRFLGTFVRRASLLRMARRGCEPPVVDDHKASTGSSLEAPL
jgi:hypothetical protein